MDYEVLRVIVEKNPVNTVGDYAEEPGVLSLTTISRHLKLVVKVKKMGKWVPHEYNENHKRKHFEISSALLLRNQNDPFLIRIVTCDEKYSLIQSLIQS